MESITAAVILINQDGVITGIDGAVGCFGLDADALGRSWKDSFNNWPEISDLPKDPSEYPCRFNATAPTGHLVSVELFRLPSQESPGRIVALLRSREETAIVAQHEQFCSLGELAASVAHEINNALTLLHGWLDLILADMALGEPNRSTIELLIGETDRIGKITHNLLEVARGAGEGTTELNVRKMLDEVLSLLQYQMKNSNVELESHLAPQLPFVHGSSGRLKQALINLLVNARQAMPSGGRVTVRAEPDGDGNVCVSVEDTGAGVPEDLKNRVFSPFFTTKRTGTGLGLPVTRKIIEDHGGTIKLETEPGTGARFTLRLPAISQ